MSAAAPSHLSPLAATSASRLAQGLDEAQTAVLAGVIQLQHFAAGDVLAREGQADDCLYAIVEGGLALVKHHGAADAVTLLTPAAGDLVHELGFLEGATRYATLCAATDAWVLVLPRAALESLIDPHPRVLYAVMRAIVHSGRSERTRMSVEAAELTNYIVKQNGRY